MLIKAKKLRDSESAVMKNVCINPDLSVKERQVQKNLRKELTRRKQNGESNLKIRRGKIVKQVTVSADGQKAHDVDGALMDDQSG